MQVAAVKKRGEADTIAKRLSSKGYSTFVLAEGAQVFRVRVGGYKTKREADVVAAKLRKEERINPWVTQRQAPVIARRADYALAVLSGVLLALSFPSFGIPALAWIALAPLLVVLDTPSLPRAFALGLTTGVVYFTGTLYWITHVMNSLRRSAAVDARSSSMRR